MKDFALIVRTSAGQSFGISGSHILSKVPPIPGSGNRWVFVIGDDQTLEVIIVEKEKAKLAVLAGHWHEVLKARLRRLGTSLSRI